MYLNTRISPTSGYARVLLFMFRRREQGGTGTGCLFQFTYCEVDATVVPTKSDCDVIFCLQLLSKTLTCILHLSAHELIDHFCINPPILWLI